MKIHIILGFGFIAAASASAQLSGDERSIIKEGNTYYLNQDYARASELYKNYLDNNNNVSPTANYNFGNTAYRKNDFDKAIEAYTRSTEQATDADTKAKAFHNLGNTYLKKNEYEKAAEAYKNALRQQPNDLDTKNNLAYALRQVQQQQQQQKQQQDKEQKDEKNDDNNKDNPEKDNTPPKEEPKDDKKNKPEEPQEPKDNSDKLMDIIEQEDKNTQKKLQERQAQGKKKDIEKDW